MIWLCKLWHSWKLIFPEDGNCYYNVYECRRCKKRWYENCI